MEITWNKNDDLLFFPELKAANKLYFGKSTDEMFGVKSREFYSCAGKKFMVERFDLEVSPHRYSVRPIENLEIGYPEYGMTFSEIKAHILEAVGVFESIAC